MKILSFTFFLLAAFFGCISFAFSQTSTVEGNIVKWFDADTVQFRQSNGKYYRVRLQGIDAPERRQTMGLECRQSLIDLTKGKTVTLQIFGDDTYKRKLGVISTSEHPDINAYLLEIGCGWEYSAPLSKKTDYQAKEGAARAEEEGLWADPCPTPPWTFRASGYQTCEEE